MAKSILFIDDEPEFVRCQVTALEEAGYDVILETDADQAMTLLRKWEFDLIILDLIMQPRQQDRELSDQEPDYAETGQKLYREIRDILGLVNTPIVFLTVVRDQVVQDEIEQHERKCGQNLHYLRKPISSSEVVNEIQRALGDPQSGDAL